MRLLLACLVLVFSVSCAEHEPVAPSSYPSSGLYTPGSTLGASDPTDVPMTVSVPCLPRPWAGAVDAGPIGTAGTLTITYTTRTYGGYFAPKNCSAVWIETADGAFVTTLELTAALRRPALVYWQDSACTEELGPDAITSGTLTDHRMHELEWSGRDFEGNDVPDGAYKLYIEVTETDLEPGDLSAFDITKGPMPYTMPLPVRPEGPLMDGTMTWAVR